MIGTLVWCPSGSETRADAIIDHLNGLLTTTDEEDREIYIVNNETEHEKVKSYLKMLSDLELVKVFDFSPQLYWSGGRNFLVDKFSGSSYKGLILFDSDIVPTESGWLEKVIQLQSSAPWLHSYMIANDENMKVYFDEDMEVEGFLLSTFKEFVCNTHYMDKKAVKILGGYASKGFAEWGFCDCEYGRRLAKSMINGFPNWVDPVRMPQKLHYAFVDAENEEKYVMKRRASIIRQYAPVFYDRARKIEQGIIPVYTDFRSWND
jgi:hypothetical protein